MVRSTCWLYSTLITNTTTTIITITTTKLSSLATRIVQTNQFAKHIFTLKHVFSLHMCMCSTCQIVNHKMQTMVIRCYRLPASGHLFHLRHSLAYMWVQCGSLDFWRSGLVWSRSCEVLYGNICSAQPPALPVASFLDWAHEPFGCTTWRYSMPSSD